jgi:hypothetical protein
LDGDPQETTDEEGNLPTADVIPGRVARGAAIAAIAAVVVLVFVGRSALEGALLALLALFGFVAAAGLVLYVLYAGVFPPKIGRGDTTLPTKPVAGSLEDLEQTVSELADDVSELVRTAEDHERRLATLEEADTERGLPEE